MSTSARTLPRPESRRFGTPKGRTSVLSRTRCSFTDLSPTQVFQKQFQFLEDHIIKLRQLHGPKGLEPVYESFTSLKSRVPDFLNTTSKIFRKIALKKSDSEVTADAQEKCNQFSLDFGDLLAKIEKTSSYIPAYYQNDFDELFKIMYKAVMQYQKQCMLTNRTRQTFIQYENSLKKSFDQCYAELGKLISSNTLASFTPTQLSYIAEKFKNISRKFEIEIPHEMKLQKITVAGGDSAIRTFHTAYITIVPLITGIPELVKEFNAIFDQLPSFGQALENLMSATGLKHRSQSAATARSLEKPLDLTVDDLADTFKPPEEDPFDVFMPKILELFGVEADVSDREESLTKLYVAARDRLERNRREYEDIKARVSALEDIPGESIIGERVGDARAFKKKLMDDFERDKKLLYQEVIEEVGKLSPAKLIGSNDGLREQLDCVIVSVREATDEAIQRAEKAESTIEKCFNILTEKRETLLGLETDCNEELTEVIGKTVDAMEGIRRELDQQLKEANPTNNELDEFLHSLLTYHCGEKPEDLKGLTNDRMKEIVGRFILDQKEDIKALKEKMKAGNQVRRTEHDHSMEGIGTIMYRMEELLQDKKEVGHSVEARIERVNELVDVMVEQQKERNAFRQFECSFLSQLLHSLKLPQIKFREADESILKDVMTSILDSPKIQKNLGSFSGRRSVALSVNTTPMRIAMSSRSDMSPLTRRSLQIPRPPSTPQIPKQSPKPEIDTKKILCDALAVLCDSTSAAFSFYPVDHLAQQLIKSSEETVSRANIMKSYLADYVVRMGDASKVEVLKKSTEEIVRVGMTLLDALISRKQAYQESELREMCRGLGPTDVDFLDVTGLVSLAKSQLKTMKTTIDELSPLNDALKDVGNEMQRGSFNPTSEFFGRFIAKVEKMENEMVILPIGRVAPFALTLVTNAVSIIGSLSKSLSAAVFAPEYKENYDMLEHLIAEHGALGREVQSLKEELEKANNSKESIRQAMHRLLVANRTSTEERIGMIKTLHLEELRKAMEHISELGEENAEEVL